jgi:transposase InsO family protein
LSLTPQWNTRLLTLHGDGIDFEREYAAGPRLDGRGACASNAARPNPARAAARATSYDNALAESVNALFKTEVIYRRGPWKSREAVERPTLEWVDWFNNRRLLSRLGTFRKLSSKLVTRTAIEPGHGGRTQLNLPPGFPGRFRV